MTTELPRLLRQRLRAQADLFAALSAHPDLIGNGRENALTELLRQFLPRRFEILEGTVAVVDDSQRPIRSTRQLDMIIVDTMDFPMLMRAGNVAVVVSQSVRGVVEVKSNLQRGVTFISALIQIARARQLLESTGPVFTALFSFGAPTQAETLRDWLLDVIALRDLLMSRHRDTSIVEIRNTLMEDQSIHIDDEKSLLEVLHNDNLPDVIAADRGAVAHKTGGYGATSFYSFLGGTNEVPSIIVLIDQLIRQLAATAAPSVRGAMTVVSAHFSTNALLAPDLNKLVLP